MKLGTVFFKSVNAVGSDKIVQMLKYFSEIPLNQHINQLIINNKWRNCSCYLINEVIRELINQTW